MPIFEARDGTEIYTKIWGQGRPVILIHGWPLSVDSWDDQAMAIAEQGFQVIAYDRRGFGRSGQPWDGYEYDTLSDDLADIMEATKAKDATIVGYSMGLHHPLNVLTHKYFEIGLASRLNIFGRQIFHFRNGHNTILNRHFSTIQELADPHNYF